MPMSNQWDHKAVRIVFGHQWSGISNLISFHLEDDRFHIFIHHVRICILEQVECCSRPDSSCHISVHWLAAIERKWVSLQQPGGPAELIEETFHTLRQVEPRNAAVSLLFYRHDATAPCNTFLAPSLDSTTRRYSHFLVIPAARPSTIMPKLPTSFWRLLCALRCCLRYIVRNARPIAWIKIFIRRAAFVVRLVLSSSLRLESRQHDDRTHTKNKDADLKLTIIQKQRKPYEIIQDGQAITLSNVATSVYPFPGGNFCNRSRVSLAPSHKQKSMMRNTRSANTSRISLPYSIRRTVSMDLHKPSTSPIMGFDTTPWKASDNESDDKLNQRQQSCHENRSIHEIRSKHEPRAVATCSDIYGAIQIDITPPDVGPVPNQDDSEMTAEAGSYIPCRSESRPGGACTMLDNQREFVPMNAVKNGSRTDLVSVKSGNSSGLCVNAPCGDGNVSPVCPTETRRYQTMTRMYADIYSNSTISINSRWCFSAIRLKEETDIVIEPLMVNFSE